MLRLHRNTKNRYTRLTDSQAEKIHAASLEILEGIGVEYAFGTTYGPRAWNGTVYYETATSVVPVPAAAWLFASGLIGLAGIARRKKV